MFVVCVTREGESVFAFSFVSRVVGGGGVDAGDSHDALASNKY